MRGKSKPRQKRTEQDGREIPETGEQARMPRHTGHGHKPRRNRKRR